MRIFIPATVTMLAGLIEDGQMPVRSGTVFAVTPALRESYSVGNDDELSDVAFREAARASLRLLNGEDSGGDHPHRRVVVAADIDDHELELRPDLDAAVARLSRLLVSEDTAAVHVDLAGATDAVAAALAVIDHADLGDEDADLTVEDAMDHELAWYDRSELPFIVSLL